jgi:hypothetical protein
MAVKVPIGWALGGPLEIVPAALAHAPWFTADHVTTFVSGSREPPGDMPVAVHCMPEPAGSADCGHET